MARWRPWASEPESMPESTISDDDWKSLQDRRARNMPGILSDEAVQMRRHTRAMAWAAEQRRN